MTIADLSERFQIAPELLEAVGARHATDAEVRELLGVHGRAGEDLSGFVFPYRDPRDGRVQGHRVRLDTPLAEGQRYLSEQGCRALFFPPTRGNELADTSVPVVIVESEKAALALTALATRARDVGCGCWRCVRLEAKSRVRTDTERRSRTSDRPKPEFRLGYLAEPQSNPRI